MGQSWPLGEDETEQYHSEGWLVVEGVLAARLVRGQRAHHARFGGPSPIVPRIDGTSSLYELQAAPMRIAMNR